MDRPDAQEAYWSRPACELMAALGTGGGGLDAGDAAERLRRYGRNALKTGPALGAPLRLFLVQLRSPLVLILILAAVVALIVQEWLDASIVLAIILLTAALGAFREYRASRAVLALRQQVSVLATVVRDGRAASIPAEEVVPGDIVRLSAGSLIPADGVVLEARDFFVSQALLTGETFPVEKHPGVVPAQAIPPERSNCVFMGTSVRSGTATALILHTGQATSYGRIAATLALRPPETELERGLRRFGGLLLTVMATVVVAVLAASIMLGRPTIETVLFAMALAVALSPELLPAILTVTLARGAQVMARRGVIVKRLNAIENLGSMDVLCADKTGTLTEGVVRLDGAFDPAGRPSGAVLRLGLLNSRLQTGLVNPLDEAVVAGAGAVAEAAAGCRKLDEIPYDFARRRLSVVVEEVPGGPPLLITKGALENVLGTCAHVARDDGDAPLDAAGREAIRRRFAAWGGEGFRVLGVARKAMAPKPAYGQGDEADMVFAGFLVFADPPAAGVEETLAGLGRLGVRLKIITGDSRIVAQHVADAVGIRGGRTITGAELATMRDEALWHLAPATTLFAEVDPNQKERIITALRRTGHVVGYLGDGINDAPALHAADVGISVHGAVDVAKEAADIVLREHDLEVLRQGIEEGRHTFANTLKYIFITTSANFGNTISMAVASLFLPFLPMLASQILLNNFLSDVPAIGIAGDNVDRDWESTPHRWDIRQIRSFMITFGLVSSVFDLLTFGVLLHLAGAVPEVFRTGWFVESLLTELLILFVIRTYKPFYRSRPATFLIWSAVAVGLVGVALPYLPVGAVFGFVPLPLPLLAAVLGVSLLYGAASELTKRRLYRRFA